MSLKYEPASEQVTHYDVEIRCMEEVKTYFCTEQFLGLSLEADWSLNPKP